MSDNKTVHNVSRPTLKHPDMAWNAFSILLKDITHNLVFDRHSKILSLVELFDSVMQLN